MTRFDVIHETHYSYTKPVFIEPLVLRLRPRTDPWQTLEGFGLDVDPSPAGLSDALDDEGNSVAHTWFDGLTSSLSITARWHVTTRRTNPFDFYDESGWPVRYAVTPPARYLGVAGAGAAADLAAEVAGGARHALVFLNELALRISREVVQEVRDEGDPLPSDETLRRGRGACRDHAVVFIDACRSVGIGTRFVSGIAEDQGDDPAHALHAWAEAYLQGPGWRGWDPSAGIAVTERYVVLAAAATSEGAAPVAGSFRGPALSSMRADIHLRSSA